MNHSVAMSKAAVTFADVMHHAGDAATMLSHGVHAAGSGVARAGRWVSENPDAVSHAAIGAGALKAKQAIGGAATRAVAAVKNKLMKKKANEMMKDTHSIFFNKTASWFDTSPQDVSTDEMIRKDPVAERFLADVNGRNGDAKQELPAIMRRLAMMKQAALSTDQLKAMSDRVKAGDPKMIDLAKKWSAAKRTASDVARKSFEGAKPGLVNPSVLGRRSLLGLGK